jgi:4-hydroxy-3-polyprenylbenzoate decarboxylase
MAIQGMEQFVKLLERKGQLLRIKEFVNPTFEIAEITDRFCKQPNGGKALLFENTGTQFPVLTNAFGSDERIALALGFSNPDEVAAQIENLFHRIASPKQSFIDKLKMLPTLREISQWMPQTVSGRGDCQQVVNLEPDLNKLPILKCWPFDGGPFITLPMVNTKDPVTGIRNVGMYRMQVFTGNLTGMHWHRHKTGARHLEQYRKIGEHMPIAIALGGDPVYTYAATAPLPDNIDEYLLAGFLRKQRVKLVKGITVDIEIPYDADIVIEGYVDPQEEMIWEGPFGDHTGFYSLADWYPKFYVTCITHKRNAIYPATIVGIPPMEDVYFAKATERIFLSPIKIAMLPEVIDMYLPQEGVAHNIAIVKISKTFPGQAYKVANSLWGAGQMMFNKIMIVVNGNVDIHNELELAQVVTKHFDPLSDYIISRGPLDILDHSSTKPSFGGKILIDATEKLTEETNNSNNYQIPDSETMAERLANAERLISSFNTKLLSHGISLLIVSVDKNQGLAIKGIASQLLQKIRDILPKIILVVDRDFGVDDVSAVVWYCSGNIDPQRDCFFVETSGEVLPCLIVDGTRKSAQIDQFPRDWPNIVASSKATIERVDSIWNSLNIGPLIQSPSLRFLKLQFGNSAIVK